MQGECLICESDETKMFFGFFFFFSLPKANHWDVVCSAERPDFSVCWLSCLTWRAGIRSLLPRGPPPPKKKNPEYHGAFLHVFKLRYKKKNSTKKTSKHKVTFGIILTVLDLFFFFKYEKSSDHNRQDTASNLVAKHIFTWRAGLINKAQQCTWLPLKSVFFLFFFSKSEFLLPDFVHV